MIYFPGKINTISTWLHYHTYIITNSSFASSAMYIRTHSVHVDILEPWRGRLPPSPLALSSSLWVTSFLLPCPWLTDSLHHCWETSPPLLPILRPCPQGPHTPPSQGTRQIQSARVYMSRSFDHYFSGPVNASDLGFFSLPSCVSDDVIHGGTLS